MPALVAIQFADISGALAYRLLGEALHIVALATDPVSGAVSSPRPSCSRGGSG